MKIKLVEYQPSEKFTPQNINSPEVILRLTESDHVDNCPKKLGHFIKKHFTRTLKGLADFLGQ